MLDEGKERTLRDSPKVRHYCIRIISFAFSHYLVYILGILQQWMIVHCGIWSSAASPFTKSSVSVTDHICFESSASKMLWNLKGVRDSPCVSILRPNAWPYVRQNLCSNDHHSSIHWSFRCQGWNGSEPKQCWILSPNLPCSPLTSTTRCAASNDLMRSELRSLSNFRRLASRISCPILR